MKKLLLIPFITTSFIFASNIDEAKKYINQHEYTKAINLLNKVKENKKVDYLLGLAYYKRHLTYGDYKLARLYLSKVKNKTDAHLYLANMYENELGGKIDMKKAIKHYKIANTKEANYKLGVIYLEGKYVLKDPKTGVKYLQRSAHQGCAKAQYLLGKLYLTGNEALNKNLTLAAKWLKEASQNGIKESKELWDKYKLYQY